MVTVTYKVKGHKIRKVAYDFYNRVSFQFYPMSYVDGRFL